MKLFPVVGLLAIVLAVPTVGAESFTLTSPEIKPYGKVSAEQVYNNFGCQGANVSPALNWHGAPVGTKSFAITVYDMDVRTGSGWWHWVVFNIPADSNGIAKNASAAGLLPRGSVQSRTDFGKPGYGGPCPTPGDNPHRYQFTVYALKVDKLPLDENAPAAMVGYYLHQNMIAKALIGAIYGR